MIWNTLSSRIASRPATVIISIRASQPAIHSAAIGLEGVRSIDRNAFENAGRPVCSTLPAFATRKSAEAVLRPAQFRCGIMGLIGAKEAVNLGRNQFMRILQPAEWSKPRGFSHGVAVDGPGQWVVLAGQTGGDEKGDYAPDMAAQAGTALKRIIKLLGEAGAGPSTSSA